MTKHFATAGVILGFATLAACSGGGGGSPPRAQQPPPVQPPPVSTLQVISVALPTTAIGRETDPTFGLVGGYTQNKFSQVLGFAPGMQVMIFNGDSARPHTLGDIGTQSFPAGQPSTLSPTGTASTTFSAGFQSGNIASGALLGPITLSAGTYFIGCAYHYQSDTMRDVLVVAANAAPGPQATPAPGAPAPVPGGGGGFQY